jgi:hypothetical protein
MSKPIQSWAGLPDHYKRQAAPEMLAGKGWYYFGGLVQHPGADELRRWVDSAPQTPQAGVDSAGSIRAAEAGINARIAHTREGISSDIAHPRTREGKRQAVDSALTANPDASNRELARRLNLSHTFIALRRRKAGNVAGADVEKC